MNNTYYLLWEIITHFPPDYEITARVSNTSLVLEITKKGTTESFHQSFPEKQLQGLLPSDEIEMVKSFIRLAKIAFKLEDKK